MSNSKVSARVTPKKRAFAVEEGSVREDRIKRRKLRAGLRELERGRPESKLSALDLSAKLMV